VFLLIDIRLADRGVIHGHVSFWPFSAAPTARRRGSYRRNTGRVGTLQLSLKVTH
jgi:hypothetical protein